MQALSSANMNTQIHCSSAFKRFANASQADMAKICEDWFEQGTKQSTIWSVKDLVVVVLVVLRAALCCSVRLTTAPRRLTRELRSQL